MWAIFVKGGPVMIPLAILSVVGLAVFIEKVITLRPSRVIQREIVNTIESVNSKADIPMALKICERYNSPFANIIRVGLQEAGAPLTIVRQAMEDTGRRETKRLDRYMVILESVAGAGPLLGLLGTVTGMIRTFSVISIAGVGQAGLLSGGIAEALITTAFGLCIGIPALIAYHLYDNRLRALAFELKTSSEELVAALAEKR